MISHDRLVSFLLRAGIATVFLYAGIASIADPTSWIGFIPPFARNVFPAEALLMIFSVYELLLALWLFSGKFPFAAALVASATLAAIIATNISQIDIVFRDIAIFLASLALAAMYRKRSA